MKKYKVYFYAGYVNRLLLDVIEFDSLKNAKSHADNMMMCNYFEYEELN